MLCCQYKPWARHTRNIATRHIFTRQSSRETYAHAHLTFVSRRSSPKWQMVLKANMVFHWNPTFGPLEVVLNGKSMSFFIEFYTPGYLHWLELVFNKLQPDQVLFLSFKLVLNDEHIQYPAEESWKHTHTHI